MPKIPILPAVASPPSSRTWRKSIARKHMHKPKPKFPTLDLDAPAQAFLKVIVDEDLDDVDFVNEAWSAVVGWEILSTPLGDINALYRIDGTTKHFTTLRQILHLVDRQDLMRLYVFVVQHMNNILLLVLVCYFREIFKFYLILKQGERDLLFGKINIYGRFKVGDVPYPLSVELLKKMLMQILEIDSDFVGNDLTIAEQLIQFIKNQIVAAQASFV
nr:hypothetical protein [Tanacetum cinerariifolium]